MTFGAPIFAWLLPLAALPVIFHLMFKRKRKQFKFPSFMFFHRADPRMNSRRRLREILLLALRVLIIACILLALSRPSLSWVKGFSDETTVVLLVDNSGSMSGAANERQTKLHLAVEASVAVVRSLKKGTSFGVATLVDDHATSTPNGLSVNKDEIVEALDRIVSTHATGDPGAALQRAFEMLRGAARSGQTGLTVHIFTDCQEAEWSGGVLPFDDTGFAPTVVVHRIPSEPAKHPNAYFGSIGTPASQIIPNHLYQIPVIVRNDADRPVQFRLNREDSAGQVGFVPVTLEPGSSKLTQFDLKPLEPGHFWMNFRIEGDGFAPDNRAGVAVLCQDKQNVALIGDAPAFGLLPATVSPTGSGDYTYLIPSLLPPAGAPDFLTKTPPIFAATTWENLAAFTSPEASTALRTYVESGGNLLVLPDARKKAGPPPTGPFPDWIGASILPPESDESGNVLEILDRQSPLWGPPDDESARIGIRRTLATHFHPLKLESPDFVPLLGLSFRKPVIAHRPFGKGNLYVSGTAIDPAWGSLATEPSGAAMVLVQHMATAGNIDPADPGTLDIVAGARPPSLPATAGQLQISSLVGDALKVSATSLPTFPRSGIFSLVGEDKERLLSVRASRREGEESFVSDDELPALAAIPHSVIDHGGEEEFAKTAQRQGGLPAYLPLILIACLAWMAEGWLASTMGKSRPNRPTEPQPATT